VVDCARNIIVGGVTDKNTWPLAETDSTSFLTVAQVMTNVEMRDLAIYGL
jgi:hypothetical protein